MTKMRNRKINQQEEFRKQERDLHNCLRSETETQTSRERTEFYDFLCNQVYVHKNRINEQDHGFGIDDRLGFIPDSIRHTSIKPGETYDHYTFRLEGSTYCLNTGRQNEYEKINLTEIFRDYNIATLEELENVPQRTPLGRIMVGRGIVAERIHIDDAIIELRKRIAAQRGEFDILGNKENWPTYVREAPKLNLDSETKQMLGRYLANEIARHRYTLEDLKTWAAALNWRHNFRDYKIHGCFSPRFLGELIRKEVGINLFGGDYIEGEEQGIAMRTWRKYCLEARRKYCAKS